ncbi:transcription-repair-coupling factor [Bacteroidia bacterium]|nr:transcription-repair-coupling factor [Bacteroidia bacterium]
MTSDQLIRRFAQQSGFSDVLSALQTTHNDVVARNLAGSSRALLSAAVVQQCAGVHLFCLPNHEAAAYFYNDLYQLLGGKEVLFFPTSYSTHSAVKHDKNDDPSNEVQRTAVLSTSSKYQVPSTNYQLPSTGEQRAANNLVIVSYKEALEEPVASPDTLHKNTLLVHRGEQLSIEFIAETLIAYGFERVDFVYEPGQFAVRGGIVDIFSYAGNQPYRLDFFGNEIETIRSFDINTQLSVADVEQFSIICRPSEQEQQGSVMDYLPQENCYLWQVNDDSLLIYDDLQHFVAHAAPAPDSLVVDFDCLPQPAFNKNFELLAAHIKAIEGEGYTQLILTEHTAQAERLHNIIANINQQQKELDYVLLSLHEGFTDKTSRICCYTDHQIFARYHKFTLHGELKKSERLTIEELNALQVGDYVVHVDHGVGVFGGLVKQMVNGKLHEYIKLVYRDDDVLMVSVHGLHRISRYKSKESEPPKIYKLGNGMWQKLKQNAKNKVKDIARDLIALYAKRRNSAGFAFAADSYLQHELEASFIYEDTPDQAKATLAVKADMEEPVPMDRLVCGDVGFGKTEIAIRAAFKAVADSKQVGVLVPTTILALQHYKTFTRRLKNLPCKVEYLSRFKTAAEVKSILADLAVGKIDILIGTHKLLSKDVKFKDLGLLVVDEEQKFGVASKEKLRQMRLNVDTLTLTATPIPRTLQFSLMGARDLSIIHTPPPNRQPVHTEVHEFSEDLIQLAVNQELARGGQVFFVHNRVSNIMDVELMLKRLCPQASIIAAHGQMEGNEMEKRVVAFINGEYDVLISTNIVENGIDIPNANTMIINQAHYFGLSDLHQLRGRVGRSNVKAHCYLLTAPKAVLTREALQRLHAVERFADLGSGFNIAMQDLDIRGAGNLLGGEQSGFITDIGFETYQKILNEALTELRNDTTTNYQVPSTIEQVPLSNEHDDNELVVGSWHLENAFVADCSIDTDLELLLPDSYVSNTTEKIKLYREIDDLQSEESIAQFCKQLADRFGAIPEPTLELLNVVRLRQMGMRLGMEKIVLKNGIMVAFFVSNAESAYYQSPLFASILQNINTQPAQMKVKEQNNKLSLVAQKVSTVTEAMNVLQTLQQPAGK